MKRSAFLLIFLLLFINDLSATVKYEYDKEPITIMVHPNYRTEIQFPRNVITAKGSIDNKHITFKVDKDYKNILSYIPKTSNIKLSDLKIKNVLNVFTKVKVYQIHFSFSTNVDDHLVSIVDKEPTHTQKDEDHYQYPVIAQSAHHYDALYSDFILNNGTLPYFTSKGSKLYRYRMNRRGWYFMPTRIISVEGFDFFYGIFVIDPEEAVSYEVDTNKTQHLDIKDWVYLNIFNNRPGQVYLPDTNLNHIENGLEIYYLYKRSKN